MRSRSSTWSRYLTSAQTFLFAMAAVVFPLRAQTVPSGPFSHKALIVERTRIPATLHANRELILWMISPVKSDRGQIADNPYSCPEETLGSYYTGPTRLSLLDTRSMRVINTIKLGPSLDESDEFNIPYRILSGLYYSVPGVPKGHEGKPRLLNLRDLNGDGVAAETAFFEKEACMGLPTGLVGYSAVQDRVIAYSAEIRVTHFTQEEIGDRLGPKQRQGNTKVETRSWIDYLLWKKPFEPRHWQYEIDYSGRGGCTDSYNLRYVPARESFVGSLSEVCPPSSE